MAKAPVKAEAGTDLVAGSGFEEFAGAGMENVGSKDLLVPRLTILQALSPQLKKTAAEYVPGAEIGDICDVATGEVFPDGVWFLPVYYRKDFLEWAPRSSGKGLIAIHDEKIMDQTTPDDKGRPLLPNGNYIAETAQFFGLNLSAGRRLSFIAMTGTQLKKSRRWNLLATGEKLKLSDNTEFTAPFFYRTYNLTTAEESNNQGDWSGWKIERGMALPEIPADFADWRTIKDEAVRFMQSIIDGEARADTSSMEGAAASDEGAM
jgi:hypothetical protein